jgi:hypothetical protein
VASNSLAGNRMIWRWNHNVVAYASGVNCTEEISLEPVECLDDINVIEYTPVGYKVSGSCAVFRTVAGTVSTGPVSPSPKGGPFAPKAGVLGSLKNPAIGLFPRSTGLPSEILTTGVCSGSLTDRLTNTTIYRLERVSATTFSFSVQARQLIAQDLSFVAIRAVEQDGSS